MNWKDTYETWKNFDGLNADLKNELAELADDQDALEDAFYQRIAFGTAGMRGLMGPGINRLNIYTVRLVTEGLAQLIAEQGDSAKQQGVVIAYDGRYHSREFAEEAVRVLGHHEIKTYLFEDVRPTPELSFAVRELETAAGIMITASHNTKEYNGYKVYGADGGQMTPEAAAKLTGFVEDVEPLNVEVADFETLVADGLSKIIGEDVDQPYLKQVDTVTIDPELIKETAGDVTIVYTPLQGTGQLLAEQAFERAGFKQMVYIPEQREPNAAFSTMESPNPEEASAFDYAVKYGKETNADVLIATDPDADRMGVCVRTPDGEYRILTGNQIGALLTKYILEAHKQANDLPENATIVKSIVSSDLPAKIAEHYSVDTVNTLTGFKFIAEQIKQYEAALSRTFMFGFEESYGFLIQPFVRDKDAVQAAVLFAELTAFYKKQGKTPYGGLEEIFETYGHFYEKTISLTRSGQSGQAEIQKIMTALRDNTPKALADVEVTTVEDYLNATRTFADGRNEEIAIDRADVLKFYLADGAWLAVRPSGTEPKIKFYVSAQADSDDAAVEKADAYLDALNNIIG